VARNDDRARDRRAKRRGEDPSAADPAAESLSAAQGDASSDDAAASLTDAQRAENEARQGVVGAPVDLGEPGYPVETDFDPPAGGEVTGGEVLATGGNRVFRFFRASWAELKRVRWPNRQQVAQGTAVTLGFVVIAGVYLGLADAAARAIVNLII
jgi:preprotein translocase SecE subunit